MKQWEYLFRLFSISNVSDSRIDPEEVGKLGKRGWELATAIKYEDTAGPLFIFKRSIFQIDNSKWRNRAIILGIMLALSLVLIIPLLFHYLSS